MVKLSKEYHGCEHNLEREIIYPKSEKIYVTGRKKPFRLSTPAGSTIIFKCPYGCPDVAVLIKTDLEMKASKENV